MAYNVWKCTSEQTLNGIKICTEIRTSTHIFRKTEILIQAYLFPPSNHAMPPHSSCTPGCKQASHRHVHTGAIRSQINGVVMINLLCAG